MAVAFVVVEKRKFTNGGSRHFRCSGRSGVFLMHCFGNECPRNSSLFRDGDFSWSEEFGCRCVGGQAEIPKTGVA